MTSALFIHTQVHTHRVYENHHTHHVYEIQPMLPRITSYLLTISITEALLGNLSGFSTSLALSSGFELKRNSAISLLPHARAGMKPLHLCLGVQANEYVNARRPQQGDLFDLSPSPVRQLETTSRTLYEVSAGASRQ